MAVDTRKLEELIESLGKDFFLETYNVLLEEVSELVEGMRNSLLDKNLSEFQRWAHRGKTTAGIIGLKQLSDKFNYFAHCDKSKISLEKAQQLIDESEKEFIMAIDEINNYISKMKMK
jgi:HPt (histidine-containing phosphotransfer) domain-containing protein